MPNVVLAVQVSMSAAELATQLLAQTNQNRLLQTPVTSHGPITLSNVTSHPLTVSQYLAQIALQQQRYQHLAIPSMRIEVPCSVDANSQALPLQFPGNSSQLVQTVSNDQFMLPQNQPVIFQQMSAPSVTAVSLPHPIIVNAQPMQHQPHAAAGFQSLQVSGYGVVNNWNATYTHSFKL
jgi:hypothetical protein